MMKDPQLVIEKILSEAACFQEHGEYKKSYLCIQNALYVIEHVPLPAEAKSRVLLEAAKSAYYVSRFEESETYLDGLDAMSGEHHDGIVCAIDLEAVIIRANICRRRGDFNSALRILQEHFTDAASNCPLTITAEKLLIEGSCYFYTDNTDRASETLEVALGFATHAGDVRLRSRVLMLMGLVAQRKGFSAKSEEYFNRAIDICRKNDDYYGNAAASLNIGISYYRRGKFEKAERCLSQSKSIFERIEWKIGVCRCLLALGNIKKYGRRFNSAIRYYKRAEKMAKEENFSRENALALEFLGEVYCEQGDLKKAESHLDESLKLCSGKAPECDIVVEVYRRKGEVLLAKGDYGNAHTLLKKGLQYAASLNEKLEEGALLRTIGKSLVLQGEYDEGALYYTNALKVLKDSGCLFEHARTHLDFATTFSHREAPGQEPDGGVRVQEEVLPRNVWNSALEASFLFQDIDSPYWNEKTASLMRSLCTKRDTSQVERSSHGADNRIIIIEYSREFLMHGNFIGVSRRMSEVWDKVQFASRFMSPILITGETGTGKELVASLIHKLSDRAAGPFVAVNCAAVPDHLFESEFFGHRKGCFTGATADRRGIFEEADTGTLFLDEIGELTPLQQVKMLRVLQENKIRRIGENIERPIDIRIMSATNQDLGRKMKESTLREDFYYRVNAVQIHIPPLKERREDIVPLVTFYMCRDSGGAKNAVKIEARALKCLQGYLWPGNVRELFMVLERVKYMSNGNPITVDMLPERIRGSLCNTDCGSVALCKDERTDGMKEKLNKALTFCRGNKSAAAKWLGISRGTLYKELRRTGLDCHIH